MMATGSQGSLRWRAGNSGLAYVLHIRRAGPEVKGLTYQAWDSLFIYRNYPILFIKPLPVGAVTVTPWKLEAWRDPCTTTHTTRSVCRRCWASGPS